jgi:dephospho-CoA kinase
MIIFGSIGRIGSGKDEVIKYLNSKYNIHIMSVGDIVREMAADKGLPLTRENLHTISSERIKKYGKEYFMDLVLKRIRENQWEKVGVTGIRTPDDVRFLKNQARDDVVLFHIYINDPHTRYERISQRKSERDPQTYDEFLTQDCEEEKMFHISEASVMADYALDNSGSLEDLHQQIDEIMDKDRMRLETIKIKGDDDG